jgi:hypothetical protein
MGLIGYHDLHGIDLPESYIHVTRIQVSTKYEQIPDTSSFHKYLNIDYDFGIFKDKTTALADSNNPIKTFIRNRFQVQVMENTNLDVWYMVYGDIKNKKLYREFDND